MAFFADGNPVAEIWDSYFDKSDGAGRTRRSRLKKAINDSIADLTADSDSLTQTDIMDGAFEFNEKPFKAKPRTVKELTPLLGMLKRAFPNNRIIISKALMMERLIESNQIDAANAVAENRIKGFVVDGVVYLNPGALDFETPIHEFGHVWAKLTRSIRPDLYLKGLELLRDSSVWKEIHDRAASGKSVYSKLNETQLQEEVMATAIGRYGDQMFENLTEQKRWDSWVKSMFSWIQQQLGLKDPLQDMKLSDFMNIAVTEILTGKGSNNKKRS